MADPAFANAGKAAGMELWRIEKLKVVKQAPPNGKFHKGDSYILLVTKADPSTGSLSWAAHFWLGSETSQDEAGIAAYKTVELDDGALGGAAIQYRECEGSESALFLSYFKSAGGIEYLPGGCESGFRHVERDVYPTRLLRLKGKRTVRVEEVPLASTSLNQGDVFVLDAGLKLYIFHGPNANKFEKAKGVEVTTNIDSDQRGGRAEIILVNEDIRNEGFWGPLGGFVDPSTLPQGEPDEEKPAKLPPRLLRISDASGSVVFSEIPLPGGKLEKELLDGSDVFIVSASNKIYVWVGSTATLAEKREATQKAVQFLSQNGLPASTPLERVSQGSESGAFKGEFAKWDPPIAFNKITTASARPEDVPLDVRALLARKAEEDKPIDDGSGRVEIWSIENFQKVPVEPSMYGQFFGGDSYIVLYSYVKNGKEANILYFWLGDQSSADEKGSAALLTKALVDERFGGSSPQVRVTQGKEPTHFLSLFKGRCIIHAGGKASGFKNVAAVDSRDVDGVALFHVRGSSPINTVAVQVPEKAQSLNSADCFVLVTPAECFVWKGGAANEAEQAVATNSASVLAPAYNGTGGRVIVNVDEGAETAEFWTFLGGQAEYAKLSPGSLAPRPARLFSCSTSTGTFRVEEVDRFEQEDLSDEDVYLLDTFTQIFVWVGSQSTAAEQTKAIEAAESFIADAHDGRDAEIPIIRVAAGNEPDMFSTNFLIWDPEYLKKQIYVDRYQAKLEKMKAEKAAASGGGGGGAKPALKSTPAPASAGDGGGKVASAAPVAQVSVAPAAAVAAAVSSSTKFSLEELKRTPAGIDPTCKEAYLDDVTFNTVFGMTSAAFGALPKWKRDAKKKEVGLF